MKENNIGEFMNSFGKFESFVKFKVIFAIELDEDGLFELAKLALERVFIKEYSVTRLSKFVLSLEKDKLAILPLFVLLIFNVHFVIIN